MNALLNEQDSSSLYNSINHLELIRHEEKLRLIISEQELLIVKTYNLTPFIDGNEWCVLLGENIQSGICGFGDSPMNAILNFNKNFLSPIEIKKNNTYKCKECGCKKKAVNTVLKMECCANCKFPVKELKELKFVDWLMDNCELADDNSLWSYESEDYTNERLFEIFLKNEL